MFVLMEEALVERLRLRYGNSARTTWQEHSVSEEMAGGNMRKPAQGGTAGVDDKAGDGGVEGGSAVGGAIEGGVTGGEFARTGGDVPGGELTAAAAKDVESFPAQVSPPFSAVDDTSQAKNPRVQQAGSTVAKPSIGRPASDGLLANLAVAYTPLSLSEQGAVAALRATLNADIPGEVQLQHRKRFKHRLPANYPVISVEETRRLCDKYSAFVASDLSLYRFWKGCDCNAYEAREYILKHLRWREVFRVDGILDEDFSDMEQEG